MIKVLFVCLGNICRSPMAEAVFRDLVKKEGLTDKIAVDSAGIGHWHVGNQPHEGTRALLDKKTISYEGIKSRQVKKEDWDDFNYIVAMDDSNIEDLKKIRDEYENVTVKKISDYVEKPKETNVPDPYFTNNFDYVYEIIDEGCQQLLNYIKRIHKLNQGG